jgi:MOSC domain-containing protein YiiM
MKILSVNVGSPREVTWQGKLVTTGIFKESVKAPILLRTLNLDGAQQADLTVHGGVNKVVYAYPSEHYLFWRAELPGTDLPWGMFGENFTTEGLLEEAVYIGDRFRIGETEVMVTEPRMPCYKLGIKFGRTDIIKRFLASRRTGFYFAVVQKGMVGVGDAIKLIGQEQQEISVADITRLYAFEKTILKRYDARSKLRRSQRVGKVISATRSKSGPGKSTGFESVDWRTE